MVAAKPVDSVVAAAPAESVAAVAAAAPVGIVDTASIEDCDFSAKFLDNRWYVQWKWKAGCNPQQDLRRLAYKIGKDDHAAFD